MHVMHFMQRMHDQRQSCLRAASRRADYWFPGSRLETDFPRLPPPKQAMHSRGIFRGPHSASIRTASAVPQTTCVILRGMQVMQLYAIHAE